MEDTGAADVEGISVSVTGFRVSFSVAGSGVVTTLLDSVDDNVVGNSVVVVVVVAFSVVVEEGKVSVTNSVVSVILSVVIGA